MTQANPITDPAAVPSIAHAMSAASAPIDILPLIRAAHPGTRIVLPLGHYRLSASAIVYPTQTDVHVTTPRGSTLDCPAGVGTVWVVQAKGFVLDGFTVPKCTHNYFTPEADGIVLTNSNIGWGGSPGDVGQAFKTGPNCSNFTVSNCNIGVTNTVSGFVDRGPFRILNTVMMGAVGEYALRAETPDGIITPSGFTIDGCEISNLLGANLGKDAAGIRRFHDFSMTRSILHGDIRLGQGNQPPSVVPGQWNTTTITDTTFVSQPKGQFGVVINAGVIAKVTGCKFVNPTNHGIICSGQSEVSEGNNIVQIYLGHPAYSLYGNAGGVHHDLGGDTVVVVPEPPSH